MPLVIRHNNVEYTFNHCLKSVAKWEQHFRKPFLTREKKSLTEVMGYFQFMCDKPIPLENGPLDVASNLKALEVYMNAEMSATRIIQDESKRSMIITNEVVYAIMSINNTPYECETWHLSRLFKLIETYNALKEPPKKMSQREIMEQNRKLNEERRRKFKSKG